MEEKIAPEVIEGLKNIAAGQEGFRDLAYYMTKMPSPMMLMSKEEWGKFFGGLDNALERKGVGNVKVTDSAEPQLLGVTGQDGKFYPYVFSHHDFAYPFVLKNNIIAEGESYPSINKNWTSALEDFKVKGFGGFILDEGSDHRVVVDRKTMSQIFALQTIYWFSELKELFLLESDGVPASRDLGNNELMGFCYDSQGTARAGLDWVLRNSEADMTSFKCNMFTVPAGLEKLKALGVTTLMVNNGLPDERPYYNQELEFIAEEAKKQIPQPVPDNNPDVLPHTADYVFPEDVILVPEKEGTFLEMWSKLPEVPYLYLPLTEMHGTEPIIDTEDMLTVENLLYKEPDGFTSGIVYTDHRLVKPGFPLARMKTTKALEQYFHSSHIQGMSFNTKVNAAADVTGADSGEKQDVTFNLPFSYTVYRHFVPRLIGLTLSKDPYAENGIKHSALAKTALKEDQVYRAFYHASLAREKGEQLEACVFTEIETMISLNLNQQVTEFMQWYSEKGNVNNSRFKLLQARALSVSGKPDDSLTISRSFLDDDIIASTAWLEQGRAMVIKGQLRPAINAFDECLNIETWNVDALLGKGIALRNLHYPESNEGGLMTAKQNFDKVVKKGGYHSSEALFHIGTICLALTRFEEGLDVTDQSLKLRNTGIARRNKVIFLHALGHIDDAYSEYKFLMELDPQNGEGLEDYFSNK